MGDVTTAKETDDAVSGTIQIGIPNPFMTVNATRTGFTADWTKISNIAMMARHRDPEEPLELVELIALIVYLTRQVN